MTGGNVVEGAQTNASGQASVEETTWQGFPAMVFQSSLLQVVVVPDRGGKIASIRSANGREWLEQPDRALPELGATSFVNGDMCGWDECAPTITTCDFGTTTLPDHGELWSQPWRPQADGWLVARGRHWDYEFARHLRVAGSQVHLDYRVTAGENELPYLWAAHPQFVVNGGSRVVLPESVDGVVDVLSATSPGPVVPVGAVGSVAAVPSGECRKYYVAPDVRVQEATLVHDDGASVVMKWTPEAPYLGIWIDRGVYARHEVVALEPSTGFYDSCHEATGRGRVLIVRPRTAAHWSLSLEFQAGP